MPNQDANKQRRRVTRLAPSPTGSLHLGNVRTFLINWALARKNNWQVVLRIDDLDGPRVKQGADQQAIDILRWLGLDWDAGPVYETQNIEHYNNALQHLGRDGWIYPCRCTRTQIAAAAMSAPHGDEHELRYPGTCRPANHEAIDFSKSQQERTAWRVRAPGKPLEFRDNFAGVQLFNIDAIVGDFLVANKLSAASYQLAVVIDDQLQGVTDVVRGADLLSSTPRQMWLHSLLGLTPPEYWHLPIVVGADGQRFAKRHGAYRIDDYRKAGVSAERLIGLIASWSGANSREEMSLIEFVDWFDLGRLSGDPVVFDSSDHDWLSGNDG